MSTARLILGLAMAGLMLAGCDRDKPNAGPEASVTVTTRPVAVADPAPPERSATTRPATRPTSSMLLINGQPVEFPRARLLVQQAQPTLVLLLCTDDPKQAIEESYSGNSYYLEMELKTVSDIKMLPACIWHQRAPSGDRAETPNGIFLDGGRRQLQPFDVTVEFARDGPDTVVTLAGQFLLFATRGEAMPPQSMIVQGTLRAPLEQR